MNNFKAFMIWSLLATTIVSSSAILSDKINEPYIDTSVDGITEVDGYIMPEENYSNIGNNSHQLDSPIINALAITKSKKTPSISFSLTGSKSASPGSKITYTIKFKGSMEDDVYLVITDDYGPGAVFMKADPAPDTGTDNTWTIKKLHPSSKWNTIKVTVKVPKSACQAAIEGSVYGVGYSSVHKVLSNDHPDYRLTNFVTISYKGIKRTLSIATNIRPVNGETVDFSEHGSGKYSSKEVLSLSSSKVSADQDIEAESTNAQVNVSGNPLNYSSSWYANRICDNRNTKTLVSEKYLQANSLTLGFDAEIHKKETKMRSDSNFTGIAEYSLKGKNISLDDMFIGRFKIRNKAIEKYSSGSKHPKTDWLCGCNDSQDYQTTDDDDSENDAENETLNESLEESISDNRTLEI